MYLPQFYKSMARGVALSDDCTFRLFINPHKLGNFVRNNYVSHYIPKCTMYVYNIYFYMQIKII